MSSKNLIFFIVILMIILLFFMTFSCEARKPDNAPLDSTVNKYHQFSQYTDPGELADLYKTLPESLDELCALIKKQLIHPFDLEKYADVIPKNRAYEDRELPSVSLMLKELLKRNENGLVASRKPEERLVVACVHHSMLLASILRFRGIPVRIRAGHAKYIGGQNGIRVTHAICEVWADEDSKWILVDPDRQRINFPRHEFEFSYETWNHLRNSNLGNEQYISRYKSVDQATVHVICLDLSYLIGKEEPYWLDPPIVYQVTKGISDLSEAELQVLDKIAAYLKEPDDHLDEMTSVQEKTPFLHFKRD
ncbi:MAG: hypothetical protein GF421_10880 [Candidatus Aminicenantes bacterium]|nr:hypothetical protein [Candidatus Aminicenantes bacterium]